MRLIKKLSRINQEINKKGYSMTVKQIGSGYELIIENKQRNQSKVLFTKNSDIDRILEAIEDGFRKTSKLL